MTPSRALCGVLLVLIAGTNETTLGQTTPEFEVLTHSDRIEVRGSAVSATHLSVLRSAARRYAPGRQIDFDVHVSTLTPTSWSVITELALRMGLALEEGKVTVENDGISIVGTTSEFATLDRLASRLSAVRHPDMDLNTRITEVNAQRTPLSTLCRRQFYTLARNNRVRYVDRRGQLRTGAKAALDRLVEVMHDCPDLRIAVRGRPESAADAVSGYLTDAGIDAARVQLLALQADEGQNARAVSLELTAP
ncbi:MAG: hypothetical protein AAGA61_01850 [Pseudomonadota bacterium]